jgi:hypothetical protein
MSLDMSSTGLSVVVSGTLAVGAQVRVTLASGAAGTDVVTEARVVHVEKHAHRAVAGLQFIQ